MKNIKLYSTFTIFIVSFVVYASTAFRTVTWWNSGEIATAALTLGIPSSPGSLITVLLGWLITRLPFSAAPIFTLNLFAGVLAAILTGAVTFVAVSMLLQTEKDTNTTASRNLLLFVGLVIGGLTFAWSETVWLYAVQYTTYIITPLFTVLIFYAMLQWWNNADKLTAYRWLFIISLLFGLDFSVHRTNYVLLPALLFWVLLRHPKTVITLKSWLYGLGGLFLGLAFHLLLIPLALRKPFINMSNPDTLSRFWDYVSVRQQGGGFLFGLFPRKAAFWDVQVMDFLHAIGKNFFHTDGMLGIVGLLPLFLALMGLIFLWQKNRKLTLGILLLFFVSSIVTILYFNIPANFFRSLDRHYLPCLTIIGILIVYGTGKIIDMFWQQRLQVLPGIAVVILLSAPIGQVMRNYHQVDGSHNYFAEDYSMNILTTLPPHAILFTRGDNDTFTLWYKQVGENIRPDVTVINMPLMNTTWYVHQILEHEPDFPLGLTEHEIDDLQFHPWQDTTIMIPFPTNYDSSLVLDSIPDTVYLKVPPTVSEKYLMIQDYVLYHIIKENAWRRPVYFTYPPQWLQSKYQVEGLAYRLMPIDNAPINIDKLKENLLEKYRYRGYANGTIPIELPTKWIAQSLYQVFIMAAQTEYQAGRVESCQQIKEKILTALPLERINPPEQVREYIKTLCISDDSQ